MSVSRSAWALIPMKQMELGKSRLSPALTCAERIQLQEAMLQDVISALLSVKGLTGISVVSDDQRAHRIARSRGVEFVCDPPNHGGLNEAVTFGSSALERMGAGLVAVIPADVPLLDSNEVEQALQVAQSEGATVVVPDRIGSGTNGLLFPSYAPPRFAYGPDSFRKHLQTAAPPQSLGLQLASFGLDLDEPADLLRARSAPRIGRATSAFLTRDRPMAVSELAVAHS
jgi:2-phospho-L-lactate guanylyltransferase